MPTGNPIGKLVSLIGKPVSPIGKPAQKQNRLAQLKKGKPRGNPRKFFFISGDICRGQKRVYKNMESLRNMSENGTLSSYIYSVKKSCYVSV